MFYWFGFNKSHYSFWDVIKEAELIVVDEEGLTVLKNDDTLVKYNIQVYGNNFYYVEEWARKLDKKEKKDILEFYCKNEKTN